MADIEDEDEYLYGSDNDVEEPSSKRQKTVALEATKDTKKDSKSSSQDEKGDTGEAEDDDEGSDSDSDSDIEFVIGDGASVDTAAAPAPTTTITTNTEDDGAEKKADTTTIVSKDQEGSGSSTLDVNGVATLDGKPLTQIDLERLANKPWRMPGADISDYFNYGFDEITWTAYCCKQDKLRGEFNPQKIMAQLMGGGKNMPMMPGMPPMMMPPMPPGMQMPPNFMNQRK